MLMVHNTNDGQAIQYAVMRATFLQDHPEQIAMEDMILITAAQVLAQEKNMRKEYSTLHSAGDYIQQEWTKRQHRHL